MLDPSFGTSGRSYVDGAQIRSGRAISDSLGRTIVAGCGYAGPAPATDAAKFQPVAYRLTPNGALDPTFSGDGIASMPTSTTMRYCPSAITLDESGRLVIAGAASNPQDPSNDFSFVMRATANGTLDPTFGAGGIVAINAGVVDRPTSIIATRRGVIVGGIDETWSSPQQARSWLAALTPNGERDASFDMSWCGAACEYQDFDHRLFLRAIAQNSALTRLAFAFARSGASTNGGLIFSVDPMGADMTRLESSAAPQTLAFDSSDRLYASTSVDAAQSRVLRYVDDGRHVTTDPVGATTWSVAVRSATITLRRCGRARALVCARLSTSASVSGGPSGAQPRVAAVAFGSRQQRLRSLRLTRSRNAWTGTSDITLPRAARRSMRAARRHVSAWRNVRITASGGGTSSSARRAIVVRTSP
jgi:uncharacterized delta-60 repeat protein